MMQLRLFRYNTLRTYRLLVGAYVSYQLQDTWESGIFQLYDIISDVVEKNTTQLDNAILRRFLDVTQDEVSADVKAYIQEPTPQGIDRIFRTQTNVFLLNCRDEFLQAGREYKHWI